MPKKSELSPSRDKGGNLGFSIFSDKLNNMLVINHLLVKS